MNTSPKTLSPKVSKVEDYLNAQAQRHQLARHEQEIFSIDKRQDRQMKWILTLLILQGVSFVLIGLLLLTKLFI